MSRFIESIRVLDGKFYNLSYHEKRMSRTLHDHYGSDSSIHLEKFLNETELPGKGLYKCRIIYDDVTREVTYTVYIARNIQKIKVVEDDEISYAYKYENRQAIDRLFDQRENCDDVLIVRHGKITDCSFSNIVLRKANTWYTPSTPLLAGTMRQSLIDKNKIELREIPLKELRSFDTFKLVNAMLQFNGPEIEVSEIVF
jgi:4-amino-4-deoxychorismate lyase